MSFLEVVSQSSRNVFQPGSVRLHPILISGHTSNYQIHNYFAVHLRISDSRIRMRCSCSNQFSSIIQKETELKVLEVSY